MALCKDFANYCQTKHCTHTIQVKSFHLSQRIFFYPLTFELNILKLHWHQGFNTIKYKWIILRQKMEKLRLKVLLIVLPFSATKQIKTWEIDVAVCTWATRWQQRVTHWLKLKLTINVGYVVHFCKHDPAIPQDKHVRLIIKKKVL